MDQKSYLSAQLSTESQHAVHKSAIYQFKTSYKSTNPNNQSNMYMVRVIYANICVLITKGGMHIRLEPLTLSKRFVQAWILTFFAECSLDGEVGVFVSLNRLRFNRAQVFKIFLNSLQWSRNIEYRLRFELLCCAHHLIHKPQSGFRFFSNYHAFQP